MGNFDDLDRAALAVLVREYLLCGHLIDRSAMPHVLAAGGIDAMREVAIEEWMGASPIYTRRIQRLLAFEGSDVETIFKGMQVDIGAPPQFMDFRYAVTDATHGEFWLDCCGALMDVEPMGDEYVVNMCHHIEDPTFDATAAATNPRARMRPIHRPPRMPADRAPHCHWTVDIDPQADPVPEPEPAQRLATSRAARLPMPTIDPDGDGETTYAGRIQADLAFERFSRSALLALLDEIALQGHLLTLTCTDALSRRFDEHLAAEIAAKRFVGIAGVAAARIHRALGGGVADVIRRHPAFHPRTYIDVTIEGETIELHDCPAIGDGPGTSWADQLSTDVLDAVVHAVDPRARCRRTARRTWTIETADEPARGSREVRVASITTGAGFVFEDR